MLIIEGARILDPAAGRDAVGDIVIEGERIRETRPVGLGREAARQAGEENCRVIDGRGLAAAPGLVDVHVHFRDPGFTYKEDIETGARAAARRVLSCAAISKGFQGKELTDMEGLLAAGAAGFTDDGIPLMDGAFVRRAMEEAARLDTVLSFHEEDKTFIKENGINHGAVSDRLGIYGSPALAENSLVARDCMIALDTGARIDIQHISSGPAVEMVRLAKKLGAQVWAEVTPHHFALTEDAVLAHGSLAKMNPPLRTERDRQMLIEGLKDGTIDMIATDHAPHSAEEKARPLTEAPSGIIGLETALALGITYLVKPGHLTLLELMKKMSTNPARLYRLEAGSLAAGAPADLVLFDPDARWTVKDFASKSANSPFVGQTLTGCVVRTICAGREVYAEERRTGGQNGETV